ncbi:MAG: GNAT family N-acetyltransferase, partial [Pseudomonadota bacterium]
MTIVYDTFQARYRDAFRELNEIWLEQFFEVEPIDAKVLGDPETHILEPGGQILFAIDDGVAIGTCALKPAGNQGTELTKMAVHPDQQGRGVGRGLLNAVLDYWQTEIGGRLFLESHSSLGPALSLYERAGFVHTPRPIPSDYERSDVY